MKKLFLKKLKKYVLVLSCVLCCLIFLSIPASAAGVSNFVESGDLDFYASTYAIPGVSGAASSGVTLIPDISLDSLIEDSNSFPYEVIGETTTNFYRNANYIQDRLGFISKSNSVIIDKDSIFDGYITGFSSRWIVKYNNNYGFIYLNDDVALQLVIMFRDKNGSYHNVTVDDFHYESNYLRFKCYSVPVDATGFLLNLVYKPSDEDLIDSRSGKNLQYYIDNNLVGNHQFWFVQTYLSFNSTTVPASEQPIYSKPSIGATSDLEGIELELVGSTNSAAQEEINKSFNISFDLIQQWAYPISAFRDAFNYFVSSHNAVYTICIMSLVVGVFLLFSNFVPRGRDK